jgi:transposase
MLFLEDRPDSLLEELRIFVYDEFNVNLSTRTISRVIKRQQWSRKRVKARAAERCGPIRAIYRGRAARFNAKKICFVDESASNERTGDRKYGWSPIGTECVVNRSVRRSERWSILLALGPEGYIAYIIHQGAITADLFTGFMAEQVLPKMVEQGLEILVLDNASIHHDERLRRLCESYGVEVEFLPPYSPDLNPIENTFKDLKSWIRRHRSLMFDFVSFNGFLDFAVRQNMGWNAAVYYEACSYNLEPKESW